MRHRHDATNAQRPRHRAPVQQGDGYEERAKSFRTTPVVSGTFSWSAGRDVIDFHTKRFGFPTFGQCYCPGPNAFDAVAGNAMFAPYELKFKTRPIVSWTTIAPTIALQSPTNNAVAGGNLVVSGSAADNTAVQKVEVRLDAGSWLTASGTSNWSYNAEHI